MDWGSALLVSACAAAATAAAPGLTAPTNLRVEGLSQPVVLSIGRPAFSFVHASNEPPHPPPRGLTQAAYRVAVWSVGLGAASHDVMVWDSGKAAGSNCSVIVYGGHTPLRPFGLYRWQVRWWRSDGAASATAAAMFETGPLEAADWGKATGFLGGTLLRAEFALPADAQVAYARAYVAAPGCHVLELNGVQPGKGTKADFRGVCPFMVPGAAQGGTSRFSPRVVYQTHNVTTALRAGANAVGLLSGHVFTDTPSIVMLLRAVLRSGAVIEVSTRVGGRWVSGPTFVEDTTFQTSTDWSKREPGWSMPAFAPVRPADWVPAAAPDSGTANTPPNASQITIDAIMMPPSTAVAEHTPAAVAPISTAGSPNNTNCPASSGLLGGARSECGASGTEPHCDHSDALTLTCAPGSGVIQSIDFAEWGTPTGVCGAFQPGGCNATASYQVVASQCVGKPSCSIMPNRDLFGTDPCYGQTKTLAVEASGCPPAGAAFAVASREATVSSHQQPRLQPRHEQYMYTFPQNFVGTVRLAPLPHAETGSTISMVLGEWLDGTDPRPQSRNAGGGAQMESHTLVHGNPDPLETVFVWHGFQYVLVTCTGNTTFSGGLDALVGIEVHTDLESVSQIEFGGDDRASATTAALFNQINRMARASMVSNVAACIPTDCPTAEKRGYLGDASFAAPGTLWNFDFGPVCRGFATIIADSQTPSGEVPDSVPCPHPHQNATSCGGGATWEFPARWGPAWCNDVAWTSGFPLITARAFEFSGDPRPAAAHWRSLTRHTENLIAKAEHFAHNVTACDPGESYWHGENLELGDWCAPANCTGRPAGSRCQISAEMAGFSYIMSLRAMSLLAAAVGDGAAHDRYAALAAAATTGFHANHWNEALASYGGDEGVVQTLNVPALALGSPPSPTEHSQVAAAIRHDLEARTDYHLSTGAVTSNWLLDVLSDNGMHDAALRVASQTTFPSWGWCKGK